MVAFGRLSNYDFPRPTAMRLKHSELKRITEAAWELSDAGPPASLSDRLLHSIGQLIPVDRVSYNEVDRTNGLILTAHSAGEPPSPSLVRSLNAHIAEHPGFSRGDTYADWPAPTKLSDHLSQRQFRSLGLYHDHFRLYGIHYQLGISFAVNASRKISFGLNRQTHDFTEEDRTMLSLLRPHLARVYRHTHAVAEIEASCAWRERALEGSASAVILTNEEGHVELCSEKARRLVGRYYPGASASRLDAGALPGGLRQSVRRRSQAPEPAGTKRDGLLTVIRRNNQQLRIYLLAEPDGQTGTLTRRRVLLRLVERPLGLSAAAFMHLGLSAREAEVLLWIARGKRNSEIAAICRLQPATVSTHVRNLFPKLGVETRTAAAAMAWETLLAGDAE